MKIPYKLMCRNKLQNIFNFVLFKLVLLITEHILFILRFPQSTIKNFTSSKYLLLLHCY